MNPRCDSRDPSNNGIRCGLDVGHMGEHTTMMRTRSWSGSPDLMDGGVTAAAIEAEVVSPERARSLVQERDEEKAWATRWQEAAEENEAEIDRLRAALAGALATVQTARSDLTTALAGYARPLTADDITDEMVERGARQYIEEDYTSWERSPALAKNNARESVRGILEAALTPPTEDPEVVALAEVLGDFAVADEHSGDRDDMVLARRLHERGVRVTGDQS